ncbi:MAG: EAL domain-containing protein [Clostridia bacterium]|nr:EAL domain-containing protein [Clostridia bacterium]
MKKNFFKEHYSVFGYSAIIVICVFLMFSAVLLAGQHSASLEEQAVTRVEGYSHDTSEILTRKIDSLTSAATYICEDIAVCRTEREIRAVFNNASSRAGMESLLFIRFFYEGTEFTAEGSPYTLREADAILALVDKQQEVCATVVSDDATNQLVLAVYAPIKDSEFIDSVVFYFPLSTIRSAMESADQELLAKADTVVLCTADGKIIDTLRSESNEVEINDNMWEYLMSRTADKVMVDGFKANATRGESIATAISISEVPYVVSIGGAGQDGGGMCIVGFYRAENAYSAGYEIVNIIITIMVIVFAILIFFGIVFIIGRQITKRKIATAGDVDALLGCNTAQGFRKSANDILKRNKATQFAIVAVEFKFFTYVTEHFGEEISNDLLKFIKKAIAREMSEEETFGHGKDGDFFILLHYREKRFLMNRLNNIYATVKRYPGLRDESFSIRLVFGINMLERSADEGDALKMMDKATIAKNTPTLNGNLSDFFFYSDSLKESYMQQADVETRAASALANNEFKVFYQPKFNILTNRIEGAEALVRWYDTENDSYRSPATFLPLFETNGFIVELDKYMYKTVCEYVSESIRNNIPVYPISFNISRFTASQDDFLSYYVGLKNEYQIPDGFITLEFSESFAHENLEFMSAVVSQMHKSGFNCSIDNFGTGTTSFGILKQIPMDEIKLDRIFIRKGLALDRDNAILENVVKTAKALKMKVIQTGVETVDDVNRLKSIGCDTIQGYYYSKPLAMVDYLAFVERESHAKK